MKLKKAFYIYIMVVKETQTFFYSFAPSFK